MTELTYQQSTVMELAKARLNTLYEFNAALRKRVAMVCAASTAIVGIVSAAKFLPVRVSGPDVESLLLGLVSLLTVAMYWFAAKALAPRVAPIPGIGDTDVLYEQYLSRGVEEAYNNFLIDICSACEVALSENETNGKSLRRVLMVFQTQIAVLALAIAWSGVAVLWGGA